MTNETSTASDARTGVRAPATGVARLHYLDRLRTALVILVIAHHAAQPYGPTGGSWPIRDPANSPILGPFFTVNAMFFMGLLFLISGYLTVGSVERKGGVSFLADRTLRLGAPVVFFMVVAFGPMAWFGRPDGMSAADLVSRLRRGGWQDLYGHLWFLAHLLLYSALYVLVRRLVGRTAPEPSARRSGGPGTISILVYCAALASITYLLRIHYPIDRWAPLALVIPSEIAHLPQYVSLFAIGTLAARGDWLRTYPSGRAALWLCVGGLLAAAYYGYVLGVFGSLPDVTDGGGRSWRSLVSCAWEALVCTSLSIGLLVLFRERFDSRPDLLGSAAIAATFGAYTLHVFVLVPLQYAFLQVPLGALGKFASVTFLGVVVSFAAAVAARRTRALRRFL